METQPPRRSSGSRGVAGGASAVLTLVEDCEFAHLGVPEFATEIRRTGLVWYHMAIPDMSTPGTAFEEAWSRDGARIFESLRAGERLLVHCAGGLGRSGMVAAKLLAALGAPADHAITAVRRTSRGDRNRRTTGLRTEWAASDCDRDGTPRSGTINRPARRSHDRNTNADVNIRLRNHIRRQACTRASNHPVTKACSTPTTTHA